jgi:hypothetical protein
VRIASWRAQALPAVESVRDRRQCQIGMHGRAGGRDRVGFGSWLHRRRLNCHSPQSAFLIIPRACSPPEACDTREKEQSQPFRAPPGPGPRFSARHGVRV